MEGGRIAGAAVRTLRERLGLIPAHAAQLLSLADGSVEDAVELFNADPNMFHVSQHVLLPSSDDLPVAAPAVADGPAVLEPANAAACALEPIRPPAPIAPPRAAADGGGDAIKKHSRSITAKKARKRRRKERAQLRAAHGVDGEPSGGEGWQSNKRKDRELAVAFARGVAAERAAAKERRGAKRINKKAKQSQKKAGARLARRRRAGQC